MEDRSNIPQNWYSPGTVIKTPVADLQFDVLIRWNERIGTRINEDGKPETEYIYDAERIDILLTKGESLDSYLERNKIDILKKSKLGFSRNPEYLIRIRNTPMKVDAAEKL